MQFSAHVKDGRLAIETPDKWKKYLSGLEGKKMILNIDKYKTRRSLPQNSYYHLYLSVIESETGNTHNELHEYFKRIFLQPTEHTILGKRVKLPRSTTELSKIEMSDYLEKICALVQIPLPDPELSGYIANNKPYLTNKENIPYEKNYQKPTF